MDTDEKEEKVDDDGINLDLGKGYTAQAGTEGNEELRIMEKSND